MVGFFFDIQDPVHIVLPAYIRDQVGISSDVHALVPGDSGVASCIPVPGNIGMASCIPVPGNIGVASCIPVLGNSSWVAYPPVVVSWPPFVPILFGGS